MACEDCKCSRLPETEAVATDVWEPTDHQEQLIDKAIANGEAYWLDTPFGVVNPDQYDQILEELRTLHSVKSGGYGTGEDGYANFTAVAALTGQPRYLYATLRAIEKLTRVLSLHEQGRVQELSEEFGDVASLMICAESMRREDG